MLIRNAVRFLQNFSHKIPLILFVTCLTAYALIASGHQYSIDGVVMFQYAKALAFGHSFVMDPPVLWGVDMAVSKWPIGLSLLYIPVLYLLSSTVFIGNSAISQIPYDPSTPYNGALFVNDVYLYSSFINPLITAFTAILVYGITQQIGFSKRKSAATGLLFGLFSPATIYTRFDFAQPLAMFFVTLSVLYFLRARKSKSFLSLFLSGLSVGLGILTRPELLIIPACPLSVLSFFVWSVHTKSKRTTLIYKIIPVVTFGIPVSIFFFVNQFINQIRFGGIFSFGYNLISEFNFAIPHFFTSIIGNLFSPGRGVFAFFPLAIFAFYGMVLLWREDRWLGMVFLSVTAGFIIFYSTWNDWGGG